MDAAKLFSETLQATPTKVLRISKAQAAHADTIVISYIPEEVPSLFIEAYLTETQYTKILNQANMKNSNIHSSYHVSKAVKNVILLRIKY